MSYSARYIPVLAIVILAMMIVPQYVQATTVSNTLIVDAPSEHTGLYDSEVNVADAASAQNVDTWNPAVQGMYFGSSTEESLYRFNEWTAQYNDGTEHYSELVVTSLFKFSSSQILSGVSEFVLRLPFYVDTDIYYLAFEIDKIPSNTSYTIAPAYGGLHVPVVSYSGTEIISVIYDPTFGSPSTSPYFTVDHRSYYHCYAPLLPDQLYLLVCTAYYYTDSQFKVYLSPNDICQDDIYDSHLVRWIPPTIMDPTTYSYKDTRLSIDVGFSFDMREGLGGQVTTKKFHVSLFDRLSFYIYVPGFNSTTSYLSIFLPFYTDNGTINLENVWFKDYFGAGITTYAYPWYGGVINAQTTSTSTGVAGDIGNYVEVEIEFGETKDITFIFNAFTKPNTPYMGTYNLTDRAVFHESGGPYYYYNLGVVCPAVLTTNDIVTGMYFNSGAQPDNPIVQLLSPNNFFGLLTIAVGLHILTGGISTIWFAVGSQMAAFTAITFPAETIVLASTILIPGTPLHAWMTQNILPYYGGGAAGGSLFGTVRNLIDNVWAILGGSGQWLQSVGEYIYDVLVWLVDAIMDYGAILLGLLIIAVALLLFFYPLDYLIRILESFYLIAQGKYAQGITKGRSTSEKAVKEFTKRSPGMGGVSEVTRWLRRK